MYTLKSKDNYQKVRGVRVEHTMYVLLEYITKFVITNHNSYPYVFGIWGFRSSSFPVVVNLARATYVCTNLIICTQLFYKSNMYNNIC